MIKKLNAATFLVALSCSVAAYAQSEVVYGAKLTSDALEFQVASGGCTTKEYFKVDLSDANEGLPQTVTLNRIKSDLCRALVPEGTTIKYTKQELGLSDRVELVLGNKIGNTSQHRVMQEKSTMRNADDFSSKPISTILNKPMRVYTSGDPLTMDFVHDRVNIEKDKSGNIVRIWMG